MQNYEYERHPVKKFNEGDLDSNEEDELIGDQKEEIFEEHQHALESERKPSVKRIVRHRIENNEVKHPANSNVIDKIFRKEYSELFKNVSSDGYQSPKSEGTPMSGNNQEGKVINKIFSRDQSNLYNNHQNDSSNFINRNDETERKDTISGMLTEQNGNSMTSASEKTSELEINQARGGSNTISNQRMDLSVRNVNNKEHNFLGQKVGSEVMSQERSMHNQEASSENNFMDKSTNEEVATEEYTIGNEVDDFYDDNSPTHMDSHDYDDYYENKEYGINYDEQEGEYNDEVENIKSDITYDDTMDILDDNSEDGEVDLNNVEAVQKNAIGLKEKAFDVTETSLKRNFKNYETEFEADLRKSSQDSVLKEDLNTISNDHTKETIIGNETLRRDENSNSSSTHSRTNGQSHSSNQLEHISNLEIDHKLNFTKINQTKVKTRSSACCLLSHLF